MTVKILPISMW